MRIAQGVDDLHDGNAPEVVEAIAWLDGCNETNGWRDWPLDSGEYYIHEGALRRLETVRLPVAAAW